MTIFSPPGERADRDQDGVEGGRSQGGFRRDPEEEEPGGTQATAIKVARGGADGGRSHGGGMAADSSGPTNGGGAGGGGVRGGDGEPKSQGDGRIRRAKAEQMVPAIEAEAGIKRAAVELERWRTEEELRG